MGWFDKKPDKSGSKGEAGKGYGKGSVSTNSNKYTPRTEAQVKRDSSKPDKILK
jgi:hypothetical protein